MPRGAGIVKGVDSKEIDNPEFVSIATYFNVRKRDPPTHLKVSQPVEDIGPYCFTFISRRSYIWSCTLAILALVTTMACCGGQ